jgi:hypothetical protein
MGLSEICCGGGVWSGFTWLRIGTVGGLLWMRWWTFGFWRHGVSQSAVLHWPTRKTVGGAHVCYQ